MEYGNFTDNFVEAMIQVLYVVVLFDRFENRQKKSRDYITFKARRGELDKNKNYFQCLLLSLSI